MEKQIKNGFADMYFLTDQGEVLNKESGKYVSEYNGIYKLKLKDGNKYKGISKKKLYFLVFNKVFCIDETEDLQNEQWKPIEGTNNEYYISSYGRVKSLKGFKAKILKPSYYKSYKRVDIFYSGKIRKTKLISRLVAAAFLDPPKSIDMQLHHIDGNSLNDKKENLVWLTMQEHTEIHRKMKEKKNELSSLCNGTKSESTDNKQATM